MSGSVAELAMVARGARERRRIAHLQLSIAKLQVYSAERDVIAADFAASAAEMELASAISAAIWADEMATA